VIKMVEDRIFPALGRVFNEFLLPVEHADRPISDLLNIAEIVMKNKDMKNTDKLANMFVALFDQKVSGIILPDLIRILNGKWFTSAKGAKQNLKVRVQIRIHAKSYGVKCHLVSAMMLFLGCTVFQP